MELVRCDFDIKKIKNGAIIFSTKRKNENLYETPNNFLKKALVQNENNKFILDLKKVIFKKDEIVFRFKPQNVNLPNKLANASITFLKDIDKQKIVEMNKIEERPKIQENPPLIEFKKIAPPRIIRNPYIYTNVESGYSAKSFPYVYIQRYRDGPQPNKFQTTPQVALGYIPR